MLVSFDSPPVRNEPWIFDLSVVGVASSPNVIYFYLSLFLFSSYAEWNLFGGVILALLIAYSVFLRSKVLPLTDPPSVILSIFLFISISIPKTSWAPISLKLLNYLYGAPILFLLSLSNMSSIDLPFGRSWSRFCSICFPFKSVCVSAVTFARTSGWGSACAGTVPVNWSSKTVGFVGSLRIPFWIKMSLAL